MSNNVYDLRRYKLAKVLVNDIPKIIEDLDYIIKCCEIIKERLKIWAFYQPANVVAKEVHDLQFKIECQKTFLYAQLNRERNVLRFKKP